MFDRDSVLALAEQESVIHLERRCWTCIAADHEDERGATVIDADKIGRRSEEIVGYFETREQADAFGDSLTGWDDVAVSPCASLRFGNVFVVRCSRPADEWFSAEQWDRKRGWHREAL